MDTNDKLKYKKMTSIDIIEEKQQEIIEEFSIFDDWMDKYSLIIDYGNNLERLDNKYKTKQNIISGCQSNVWLHAELKDDIIIYKADSDAVITKGIIALLLKVISGHKADEIINANLHFIEKIGLKEHLSPTRANGLLSMIKQIKLYAIAFKYKQES